jgi:hypothetical protein
MNNILVYWARFLSIFGYYDKPLDEHTGLYDGLVLPPTQHMCVYVVSLTSIVPGCYALSRGYYDLATVPLGTFCTSINYWRNPVFVSHRRTIDIIYVQYGLWYQIYRAYSAENAIPYYIILFTAVSCFPLSWYFHKNKQPWKGTFIHSMVHIIGNISNMVLYSGRV